MPSTWTWLLRTSAGLATRIVAGAAIFLCLALLDLYRRGRAASRWREYSFLLATIAVAMIYGVINDLITSRISWEYFYYGKELAGVLGPLIPPEPAKLSWEAGKVGLKATWA